MWDFTIFYGLLAFFLNEMKLFMQRKNKNAGGKFFKKGDLYIFTYICTEIIIYNTYTYIIYLYIYSNEQSIQIRKSTKGSTVGDLPPTLSSQQEILSPERSTLTSFSCSIPEIICLNFNNYVNIHIKAQVLYTLPCTWLFKKMTIHLGD